MSLTGKLTAVALSGLRNQMRLTAQCVSAQRRIFTFPNSQTINYKSSCYNSSILSKEIRGSLVGSVRGYCTSRNQISQHCIKLRGLPYTATKEDVIKFLDGVKVRGGDNGILFINNRFGRPVGIAFVQVESEDDVDKASKLHKQYLGSRYIEVFTATSDQFAAEKNNFVKREIKEGYLVCLKGLPYSATVEEINVWLSEAAIPSEVDIVTNYSGKPSGKANAYFTTQEEAQTVVEKMNKKYLGSRYVDVIMGTTTK